MDICWSCCSCLLSRAAPIRLDNDMVGRVTELQILHYELRQSIFSYALLRIQRGALGQAMIKIF